MKITDIAKACGISRQMVYILKNDGLSENEIIQKYVGDPKLDSLGKTEEYKAGFYTGYREASLKFNKTKNQDNKKISEINQEMQEKLIKINSIVKKITLDYQQSYTKEVDFKGINDIYEIVKEYNHGIFD